MFILILGLGRTGSNLADLLQKSGHQVVGTSRSKPGHIIWQASDGTAALPDADTVVCAFPPSHTYAIQMEALKLRYPNNHIIQISSTGVFAGNSGEVSEDTKPITTSAKSLLLYEAEQAIISHPLGRIVRAGGLYDENNHPIQFLSGKDNIDDPEAPVNLVHRQDLAEIIFEMIEMKIDDKLVHAVNPNHPLKIDYYTQKAQELKLPLPHFSNITNNKKIVRTRLKRNWRNL